MSQVWQRYTFYYLRYIQENKEDWSWFENEWNQGQISRAWHWVAHQNDNEALVIEFIKAFYELLNRRGKQTEIIEWCRRGLLAAQALQDEKNKSGMLSALGRAKRALGYIEQAIELFEQAQKIDQHLGDKEGEMTEIGNLGSAYAALGEWKQAIEFYQQALAWAQETGDQEAEMTRLGNIGTIYHELNDLKIARGYYERTLELALAIGSKDDEATVLGNLGQLHKQEGELEQATDLYQQQLAIMRELGDLNQGTILSNFADIFVRQGQFIQAVEYYERAIQIARQIDDPIGELSHLGALGLLYDLQSEFQHALSYFERQLILAQKVGIRPYEANALVNIGNCHLEFHNYIKAIEYYEEALAISVARNDRHSEATQLASLANVYHQVGALDDTIFLNEYALALFREFDDFDSIERSLYNIGIYHIQKEEPHKSRDYLEEALQISEQLNNLPQIAIVLNALAATYRHIGKYDKAKTLCLRSIEIEKQIGNVEGEIRARWNLGLVYWAMGEQGKALTLMEPVLAYEESLDHPDLSADRKTLNELRSQLSTDSEPLSPPTVYTTDETEDSIFELAGFENEFPPLVKIARIYMEQERPKIAVDFYQASLQVIRGLRSPEFDDLEGFVLAELAGVYYNMGHFDKAIGICYLAHKIFEQDERHFNISVVLVNIANAYMGKNDWGNALKVYNEQLEVLQTLEGIEATSVAVVFNNIANAHNELGNWRSAVNYYCQALAIADQLEDRSMKKDILGNLGMLYDEQGEYQKAIGYYKQQLKIAQDMDNQQAEAIAQWDLGTVYESLGDLEQAIALMTLCVDFERQIGHTDFEEDAAYVESLRKQLHSGV